MQTLRVKCLRTGAKPPHYASASAAGADLYACLDAPMTHCARPDASSSPPASPWRFPQALPG